jgi:hypothetical protein
LPADRPRAELDVTDPLAGKLLTPEPSLSKNGSAHD